MILKILKNSITEMERYTELVKCDLYYCVMYWNLCEVHGSRWPHNLDIPSISVFGFDIPSIPLDILNI